MRDGVLYLNNHGTKFIVLKNGKKESVAIETPTGTVRRIPQFYEQWGNFCIARIWYKGELRRIFMDKAEMKDGVATFKEEDLLTHGN